MLAVDITVEGTITDFTASRQATFRTGLATILSVAPSSIVLSVRAASIIVTATVPFNSTEGADAAAVAMRQISAVALSNATGATIQSIAQASVSTRTLSAAPPGATPLMAGGASSLEAQNVPQQQEQQHLSDGQLLALVAGVLLAAIFFVGCVIEVLRWRRNRRRSKVAKGRLEIRRYSRDKKMWQRRADDVGVRSPRAANLEDPPPPMRWKSEAGIAIGIMPQRAADAKGANARKHKNVQAMSRVRQAKARQNRLCSVDEVVADAAVAAASAPAPAAVEILDHSAVDVISCDATSSLSPKGSTLIEIVSFDVVVSPRRDQAEELKRTPSSEKFARPRVCEQRAGAFSCPAKLKESRPSVYDLPTVAARRNLDTMFDGATPSEYPVGGDVIG